jgi:soluble lytic murein transglycosylase-like protein
MRILCREYYERHVHLEKSICLQCGCKMLAGMLIIGASILFPAYTTLSRAQCASFSQYRYQYRWLNWNKYWPIIQHSDVHNINPALAFAIVDAESNGNEKAISCTGARGLFQVQHEYHYNGNPQDLHHIYLNTMIATRYLAACQRMAKGNLILTLKCYERGYYGKGINVNYTAKIEQNLRGTI